MTESWDYEIPDEEVSSQSAASTGSAESVATASSVASESTESQDGESSGLTEADVQTIIQNYLSNVVIPIRSGYDTSTFRFDPVYGLWLGASDFANAPFRVDMAGNMTATSATISGSISVGAGGTIGGFDVGADYIRDVANTFGLASTVSGSNDVRFWAGASFTNRATAPFRLFEDGSFVAKDGQFAGTLKTSVFERDVVSAVGGQLIVANSDVLDSAMTALDASTLTIKGETTFAVNDILHIKDGTDDEYLRVTSIVSAPTYSVTRDLAAAYAADSNPAWAAGSAVVVEGLSNGASVYSGGYLRLLGAGTGSPRYSVFARTGVAYNAVTEYIGIGNLNGLLDYVAETYGIAIGTAALGSFSFDVTNGLRVSGGLNNQTNVVAGENISAGNACVIRTNEIVKQEASHDARVLETATTTNYGNDTTALLGSTNALGTGGSWFFVKFDLSTIVITTADKAYIRLRCDNTAWTTAIGALYSFGVFQVTGADWVESTITWATKPAIGAVIMEWQVSNEDQTTDDFIEEDAAENYVYLDITTLYNSWKSGTANYGVAVRFVLRGGIENSGAVRNGTVATSENATVAFRPTIIVSGASDNAGKAYKANSTNFTDLYGPIGFARATVTSGQTVSLQRSGVVSGLSGLTTGKTYYITDSETLSTTPGTIVREVGVALSATTLDIDDSFQRIVSDRIIVRSNDTVADHNSTNSIFIPLGFKPKLIRFDGTYKAAANTRVVTGIWQNGVQFTNSNNVGVDSFLVYEIPTANETTTLTVTSVNDTGVVLTYVLKDDSINVASNIDGILTFER